MNVPYNEKYRPKTFDEVVGVSRLEEIKNLISSPMDIPNFLFVGDPGLGKTTVAKIIINELQPIDVLRLNGSDTTGVDVIRDKVYNFMTGMSSVPGKPKLIWIEEFDYLSLNAQAALRGMIEQFVSNARFICTANYLNKISEPIRSRFSIIEFSKPTDSEINARLKFICESEGITASDSSLSKIVTSSRGDLRTSINMIQQLSANGFKTIPETSIDSFNTVSKEVYSWIRDNKWSKIRYELPNKHPDYENLLVDLADIISGSEMPTIKKANAIEIISDGQVSLSLSFNKDISFCATASRLMKSLNGDRS